MTVVMKIDLAGPRRRGLALGLNEAAGYLGVAAAAFATGALAASYAPRTVVWVGAALIAARRTAAQRLRRPRHRRARRATSSAAHGDAAAPPHALRGAFAQASLRDPVLRACSQAGLVNNLNDALAWGLAPLYLAAHGASVREIAIVAAAYPVVWGAGQLVTGWLSDHTGRKPLITGGMLVQAGALALLVAGGGAFAPSLARRRPARRRHGDGLPDADRRRLRRQPAARPRPRRSASTASGATSASSLGALIAGHRRRRCARRGRRSRSSPALTAASGSSSPPPHGSGTRSSNLPLSSDHRDQPQRRTTNGE